MNPKNYDYIITFFNLLAELIKEIDPENFVEDSAGKYNEKEYLTGVVKHSRHFLNYGERILALEHAIDNLGEVNYKLDDSILDLAEFVFKNVNQDVSPYADSYLKAIQSMRKG